MAFDSNVNTRISIPLLVVTVNDWNVNTSLSLPRLTATLNSYNVTTAVSLPVVSFACNIADAFSITATLAKPVISSLIDSTSTFTFTRSLQTPSLAFTVNTPLVFALNNSLPVPRLAVAIAGDMKGVLAKQLALPTLDFSCAFTWTGSKQTWVFNTITGAHSRYTNFNFDSYFKLGANFYGILDGGIYQFTGDVDKAGEAGQTNIDAQVDLPISTFNEQTMKACSDALLYGRINGDLLIDVVTDEQQVSTNYLLHHDLRTGMHRIRAKIPKGLKGNTWQFKLRNVNGSYFDVNGFEVFLRTLQRVKW